ncbi:hypothetical protein GCM10027589_46670 [Actinocorallia lasiicapitis]
MGEQHERLLLALGHAAAHAHDVDTLAAYLRGLGVDHRKFGALPDHYPAVGASLIATLAHFSGARWTGEVEKNWLAAYEVISSVMIEAAAEAERDGVPPWWDADVLLHELRTPDVAVLTVHPDRPYPFRSGQFLSVSSPRAPQVWRPYSIANPPRADGTLELHVRRVPSGLLSGVLVDDVRPGDRLRLGAPMGELTVPRPGRALIAVAGGTGWAPIKSLIIELADRSTPQPATLIVAARSPEDVYDRQSLAALNQAYDWLRVDLVVPGRPPALLELIKTRAVHPSCDVVVSGPAPMVEAVRRHAAVLGLPAFSDPWHGKSTMPDPLPSPSHWFLHDARPAWINPANRPY